MLGYLTRDVDEVQVLVGVCWYRIPRFADQRQRRSIHTVEC